MFLCHPGRSGGSTQLTCAVKSRVAALIPCRHDVALKIHIIKALGPVEHVRPSGTCTASIQGVKRGRPLG
ncbi:hypothetical protein PISMIDRAFT_686515 [Pisolithus microcarpus 441]|uniref:Uncharacterized protein n=1 Tax=Pisolithus microcarpus 441 TaxID=765257 RepID=A0A0C9YHN9_9AGAM|nr:hypothetical protein PISMIDRAFT_686515 [Pisolithus microcarpus 441]